MSPLDRLAAHVAPLLLRHARGQTLLAAVSGGCDSVALALVLVHALRSGAPVRGVCLGHVDHGLHPASGRAADAVAELARRLEVPIVARALRLPVASSEARLRELRYAALAEMADETGATCVLTAHHADDELETILFRALRGTGPRGLCGIPAVRPFGADRTLLRPFLDVARATLRDVVAASGEIPYEDPTNRDLGYARNRLRHEVLPRLRARSGDGIDRCLRGLAAAARRVTAHVDATARAYLEEHLRRVTPWRCELALPAAAVHAAIWCAAVARSLALLMAPAAPPWSLVRRATDLRHAAAGTRVHGPRQPLVERTRELLLLVDPARAGAPPEAPVELVPDAPPLRFGATEWSIRADRCAPVVPQPGDRYGARLDAASAPWPWRLRCRRAGERFTPLGRSSSVELLELASQRGVPRFDRDRMPLVVDADDRVLWVPGAEIAAAARLHEGSRCAIALRATRG
jgi:tRNA(Ile)-lysidine synthase